MLTYSQAIIKVKTYIVLISRSGRKVTDQDIINTIKNIAKCNKLDDVALLHYILSTTVI